MREEALSARVNSCPSQNLRGCEFFFCGGGEDITGGARLLVVPLGPRFRSVIPRNFSSGESALQLLLIENRAFLAGSRPLGTMREEALSARVNSCPSQNLRGCESWVGGAGGDCGKGTHSCVPLRLEIRFRADQAQLRMCGLQQTPNLVISSGTEKSAFDQELENSRFLVASAPRNDK